MYTNCAYWLRWFPLGSMSMTQREINTGKISNVGGEVIVSTGDVTKIIKTIYQRSLSAIEEADVARSIERRYLAEAVKAYSVRLKGQVEKGQHLTTPYRGLLTYRIADCESFFGRSQAITALLKTMDRGNLAVLQAESGAGKTSLLQAGIAPRILVQKHLPICLRPYDESPTLALKKLFLPNLSQYPILAETPLRDILSRIIQLLGGNMHLFIIIDQFEEFFERIEEPKRRIFINELGECLDDASLGVHWLISLRSEYFGKLADFRPRISNPFANEFSLKKLNRLEAEEVITRPAKKFGFSFEDGLVDLLLDDLGKDQIAPPQLQLVCSALVENTPPAQNIFTKAGYLQAGATAGILREHLNRVIHQFPIAQRVAVRKVLEALISSVQQRVLRPYDDLSNYLINRGIPKPELEIILQQLTDSRLLRIDENDAGVSYELAHDYLLDEIRLDPEVKKQKQAEELLEQGLRNWDDQEILLSSDAIQVIEKQRDAIHITGKIATLMFLSAVNCEKEVEFWLKNISPDDERLIINKYTPMAHDAQVEKRTFARTVLSKFYKNLPSTLQKDVQIWRAQKFGTKTFKMLPGLIGFLFLGLVLVVIAWINTVFVPPFPRISGFDAACLDGAKPVNPMVAVDANNPAHMAVFDPGKQVLCQTFDTAYRWKKINALPPSVNTLKQLVVNKKIHLVTSEGAYYENGNEWRSLYPTRPNKVGALAISPQNSQEIWIWTKDNAILMSMDGGINWKELALPQDQFNHEIILELTTNSIDLVAASAQNIWFYRIKSQNWERFDLRLGRNIAIQDVDMIGPASDAVYVLAGGALYLGNLHDQKGVGAALDYAEGVTWPDNISSLSVYKTAILVGSRDGVYCSQSWHVFNPEWWRWKMNWHKPCQ